VVVGARFVVVVEDVTVELRSDFARTVPLSGASDKDVGVLSMTMVRVSCWSVSTSLSSEICVLELRTGVICVMYE